MMPKLESVAPDKAIDRDELLNTYIKFLALREKSQRLKSIAKGPTESQNQITAATFDPSDPASPLAYSASQTALLLLDFQYFITARCGTDGQAAVRKAKAMRDWALKQKVMVVHSVVDVSRALTTVYGNQTQFSQVHEKPPSTCKGAERITKMLASVEQDQDAAEEPAELAFSKADREYIVLKHPALVSALKSNGIMELLKEYDIRSLVLCGLSTSGVVLRTALAATDEGFVVSVIKDACADRLEGVGGLHEIIMETVLPSRTHIATVEEFIQNWKSRTEG